MKVVFAARAKADLQDIARYIARRDRQRAKSFVAELKSKALALGDQPHAFALVERYAVRGMRRRVMGDYLIFYRIDEEVVTILRILHGARDYETLLTLAKTKEEDGNP